MKLMMHKKTMGKLKKVFTCLLILTQLMPQVSAAFAEDYRRLDVFVLMDNSNSMHYSDSKGIRFEAFDALTGLMGEGDRVGLFQFGAEAKLVFPLTEAEYGKSTGELHSRNIPRENMIYTDVKDVLSKAFTEAQVWCHSERMPLFILLSDGEIDPADSYDSDKTFRDKYLFELKQLAYHYQRKNWPVYILNLNENEKQCDENLTAVGEITGGYTENIQAPAEVDSVLKEILTDVSRKKTGEESGVEPKQAEGRSMGLRVTTPCSGKYRLNDNLEIRGEVVVNNRRVRGGSDPGLVIKEFYAVVHSPSGNKIRIDLNDNGVMDNGDVKPGDGIYSAFFKPQEVGKLYVSIYAAGEYKDERYNFTEVIEDLYISSAGKITINTANKTASLYPGKTNIIPVEAVVESDRIERLEFLLIQPEGFKIEDNVFFLPGNKKNTLKLALHIPENLSPGQKGVLNIKAVSSDGGADVIPEEINLPYSIERSKAGVIILSFLVSVLGMCGILFFARVYFAGIKARNRWVRGRLAYWKENDPADVTYIELYDYKSDRVCLRNTAVNFNIQEDIDIEIYSETDNRKVSYYATGGIDNILYVEGLPHKTLELRNGLCFTIKSYMFCYYNPESCDNEENGTNVLHRYEV